MIRIYKLSQRAILTESNAPATAEDGNRTRIIFHDREKRREALPNFSFLLLNFAHFASHFVSGVALFRAAIDEY